MCRSITANICSLLIILNVYIVVNHNFDGFYEPDLGYLKDLNHRKGSADNPEYKAAC